MRIWSRSSAQFLPGRPAAQVGIALRFLDQSAGYAGAFGRVGPDSTLPSGRFPESWPRSDRHRPIMDRAGLSDRPRQMPQEPVPVFRVRSVTPQPPVPSAS